MEGWFLQAPSRLENEKMDFEGGVEQQICAFLVPITGKPNTE